MQFMNFMQFVVVLSGSKECIAYNNKLIGINSTWPRMAAFILNSSKRPYTYTREMQTHTDVGQLLEFKISSSRLWDPCLIIYQIVLINIKI